ncbi:helix-turn-helix domain-containing protein [Bacillus sp. D386]|uniref:helix-turn-helix domain-containing protein n=1 Tax=Bacillus sp. D386 TaxID=2587155 RepID=UPI001120F699|nr:helix-turn-helix domain-containing protein [Bacillus sp. D386]
MDFSAIGQRIRELRKSLKLSQDELAQGVCTQAQISKIEKGDVYPYANTLYLISKKLGVDVNYFFEIGSTPRVDYVNEVSRQLRLTRRHLLYDEMNRIVKLEENNPLFTQNGRNKQLILWHKGIYEHAVNNNVEKSIDLLQNAIDLTHVLDKVWNEREIEVLMSMGAVYVTDNQNEIALKIFLEAKAHLSQLFFISDHSILPRLYYNIARVYTRIKQYDESITYCKKGIQYCIEKDNLFPLAELHYQVSYNYEKLGDYSQSIFYVDKAISIFELNEDTRFMNLVKEKKRSLEVHLSELKKADQL